MTRVVESLLISAVEKVVPVVVIVISVYLFLELGPDVQTEETASLEKPDEKQTERGRVINKLFTL